MDPVSAIIRIFISIVCMAFGVWLWSISIGSSKFYTLLGVAIAAAGLVWFYWTLVEVVA